MNRFVQRRVDIFGKMISLLVAFIFACTVSADNCNRGSDYWCKNEDTAVECGVLEYCRLHFPENFVVNKEKKIKFHSDTPAPVKVELYYESLCPGCRAFIMGQLYPTFQKLQNSEIMDIGLYPYGNAQETQRGNVWEFNCQHGPEECDLNLVETCALHMLSHPVQFMPFIHCLETNPSMANAKACASQLAIEWGPISNCVNGSEGNHLEHQMAVKTRALNPPHQYVPWIVVNGVHNDQIQEAAQSNLMQVVCTTYTGVKPHACRVAETDKFGRCHKN